MKATTQQADFVVERRREAWAFGRQLRDHLLRSYQAEYGLDSAPPPAIVVDELLRDFLQVRLHYDPLPLDVFAKTERRDGILVVTVNSRTAEIAGVKDAPGVQNVAKWHEAVHCERDLAFLNQAQPALLAGFDASRTITCFRGGPGAWKPEDRGREFFAEEAGRAAAVAYSALAVCPSFQSMVEQAGRLSSSAAWSLLYKSAQFIGVNASALVTQLELEGWIRVESNGGRQHLYVQPGLELLLEASQ